MAQLDQVRKNELHSMAQELLDSIADTDPTPTVNPLQAPLDEALAKLAAARAGLVAAQAAIEAVLTGTA